MINFRFSPTQSGLALIPGGVLLRHPRPGPWSLDQSRTCSDRLAYLGNLLFPELFYFVAYSTSCLPSPVTSLEGLGLLTNRLPTL